MGDQNAAAQYQGQATTFADNGSIPLWAMPYVWEADVLRLVNGFLDNTFRANQIVTQSDEMAFIAQFKSHYAIISIGPTISSISGSQSGIPSVVAGSKLVIDGTNFQSGATVSLRQLTSLVRLSPPSEFPLRVELAQAIEPVNVVVVGNTQIDVSMPTTGVAACVIASVTSNGQTSNTFSFAVVKHQESQSAVDTGNALVTAAEAAFTHRCDVSAGGKNYIGSLGSAFTTVTSLYHASYQSEENLATDDPTQSMSMLETRPGEGGQCNFFVDLLLQESGVYNGGLNYGDVQDAAAATPSGPLKNYYVPITSATDIRPGDVLITNVAGLVEPHTAIVVAVSGTAVTMIDSNYVGDEMIGQHTLTVGSGTWDSFHFGILRFSHTSTAPTVTSVAPSSGSSSGGTSVTINGTGFTGATSVLFGTTPAASFRVISDGEIQAVVPAGTGTVNVTVTTSTGVSMASASATYDYTSVGSTTGTCLPIAWAEASSSYTIEPSGGPPENAFACNPAIQWNAGAYTATIEAKYAEPATVTGITFLTSSSPSTQEVFTIYGSTDGSKWTQLIVSPQSVSSVHTTLASVRFTPTTLQYLRFDINGEASWAGLSDVQLITLQHAPVVSGVSPDIGPALGGTPVTITGSGLLGATAVDFGSTPASSFSVQSDTQITAVAPAGTGAVDVTVTTEIGTSTTSSADLFTFGPTSNLTAPSLSASTTCYGTSPEIDLSWTPVTGADDYELYRSPVWGSGSSAYAVPTGWTSFQNNTNLIDGQSYTYEVAAEAGGTTGPQSNFVTVTAPTSCAPSQPTLTAPSLSASTTCYGTSPEIDLSWSAVSGASDYVLTRSPGWISDPNPIFGTSFANIGPVAGHSYTYQVVAQSGGATGPPSNSVTVTATSCGSAINPNSDLSSGAEQWVTTYDGGSAAGSMVSLIGTIVEPTRSAHLRW